MHKRYFTGIIFIVLFSLSACSHWQTFSLKDQNQSWYVVNNSTHSITDKLIQQMTEYGATISKTPTPNSTTVEIESLKFAWSQPKLDTSYPTQIKSFRVAACLKVKRPKQSAKHLCFHPQRALLLTDQQGFSTSQAVTATENQVWAQLKKSILFALMSKKTSLLQ
jgi:hypothetical protein